MLATGGNAVILKKMGARKSEKATLSLACSVTAVVGLFVFAGKKSFLHFMKPVFRFKVLASSLYGDNEKNAVMPFGQLDNFPGWYKKNLKLILIKPSADQVSVEAACKKALYSWRLAIKSDWQVSEAPMILEPPRSGECSI